MSKASTRLSRPTRSERRGFLEGEFRRRTREWIEMMVNEEFEMALGGGRYERTESRRGYRKGARERTFTTRTGKHEIAMPRGAYFEPGADGKREWNSRLIGRYARRSDEVEEALVKSYLCGTNTRKIERALGPLLEGAALSKSTVSRLVSCLAERFEQKWHKDCPAVVKSLREGGEQLLTFHRYPKSMWRMLRTTNCIERLNEEFRRRVKTQGSFPNADAGLKLFYGMCAADLVLLRRIDGWKQLAAVVSAMCMKHGLIKPLDIAA